MYYTLGCRASGKRASKLTASTGTLSIEVKEQIFQAPSRPTGSLAVDLEVLSSATCSHIAVGVCPPGAISREERVRSNESCSNVASGMARFVGKNSMPKIDRSY